MNKIGAILFGALVVLSLTGAAQAASVPINANIATSAHWTADNVYNLVGQIYVLPGATLTIDPGVVVKSVAADAGSLAVCAGAKIYANGTEASPIVFTSSRDDMVTWKPWNNEWGNITIMGNGLISASKKGAPGATHVVRHIGPAAPGGRDNTAVPDGLNKCPMEGLVADNDSDTKVLYGGNNDDDDSGALHYVSLRYGGKVLGQGNELNGLSLGAIGRETDIDHIDIMNSIDDGIEIWGGTVNVKYASIWNFGDDGFDTDQGWRGKAQFCLLVQGYSTGYQGGGVSDNIFETDGAEDSDAQPITTPVYYNFTCIGQPHPQGGDNAIDMRDGARGQWRNCIFMDVGEKLINDQFTDGDNALGYGLSGTLSFSQVWQTNYDVFSPVNAIDPVPPVGSFNHPAMLYRAQTSGKLAEFSDNVVYNITGGIWGLKAADDNTHNGGPVDLWDASLHNEFITTSPITAYTREDGDGLLHEKNITNLDPRPVGVAATSYATAPADGFFTPAQYRGAFSPSKNWLLGWSTPYKFGFMAGQTNPADPTDVTLELKASVLSFPTVSGVSYLVEQSTDNVAFTPFATVVGDGTTKTVTALVGYDSAKFYRVSAL